MPEKQLRAIVAKRLSSLTDSTTHIETENATIEEYLKRKNILVWRETEDLDVSGGKPIRERPGVGPLLAEEYLDEWDVLIIYKLDRGFRNHYDFVTFFHEYCEVHGKTIVAIAQDIDMTTRMGRFFAGQLVQFAEWELLEMKDRRARAAVITRTAARWAGGPFPFWCEPYKDGPYWYLRLHPERLAILRDIISQKIKGRPLGQIAAGLNQRKIPTAKDVNNKFFGKPPKGYEWRVATLRNMLRSDSLRGYVMYHEMGPDGRTKQPVRAIGPDGQFIRRVAAITDDVWYKLQAALDHDSNRLSGARSGGSPLLRIAFCGYCGSPLYQMPTTKPNRNGERYEYYVCQKKLLLDKARRCGARGVPKEALERTVFGALLETVGSCELTRTEVLDVDDNHQTLMTLGMQIADLTKQHYMHGGVPDFHAKMSELQAEHERISELPKEKPKLRRVATGKTFREFWDESDDSQRRAYLKAAQVNVMVIAEQDYSPQDMLTGSFPRTTDEAASLTLDLPTTVVRELRGRFRFVASINLGTLSEQLMRARSAGA